MRKTGKRSVLKYFQPVDMDNVMSESLFDTDDDIDNSLGHFAFQSSKTLFLNRFKPEDIMSLLTQVGLIKHLNSIGFNNIKVDIKKDENLIHHLKIYYDSTIPENLLINLRVSESKFVPDKRFFEDTSEPVVLDMVIIEWLSAQKPAKNFDSEKPQLPGQSNPGLGSLSYMMELMYLVGDKLFVDGFMDIPDHLHGAVMYSRKFKFFNPSHEAVLKAILRDLKDYSLTDLSWGMITKTIIDKTTGQPQVYDPSEQIVAVSKFMKDYFNSKKYQNKFSRVYKSKKYYFDYEAMLKKREELLREKKAEEL